MAGVHTEGRGMKLCLQREAVGHLKPTWRLLDKSILQEPTKDFSFSIGLVK